MSAEEIARRFANVRAGYELVFYREVALPLFRVDLELLVLERKAIPPMQEYVLRAVERGLVATADIAGLLGMDEDIVRRTAAELLSSDELALAPVSSDRQNLLHITAKGRRAAAEAASVQAVEVSLPVWVDGLTREVLSVSGRGQEWFPAGHVGARGLAEIPAYPRKRPELASIPLEEVQRLVRSETAGRRSSREVIGITGMGKARRFAREGVALAYRTANEPEPLIALVVDEQLSDAHDAAFSRAMARSARNVVPEDWRDARDVLAEDVPSDLLGQAAPATESERLEEERDEIQRQTADLREATVLAGPDELAQLREDLRRSEERAAQLETAINDISVRQVAVYEHRDYLDRALSEARHRVLIVSPWIRSEVVDDALVSRLRKLLDRGVEVWIGYGISKQGGYRAGVKGEQDREAEGKLRRLSRDYPSLFHMARLGDTHAKVLVCDSRFSILTSFNWLSFRGDVQLQFRDERGYYVGLQDKVDELFESYRVRFEGQEA